MAPDIIEYITVGTTRGIVWATIWYVFWIHFTQRPPDEEQDERTRGDAAEPAAPDENAQRKRGSS